MRKEREGERGEITFVSAQGRRPPTKALLPTPRSLKDVNMENKAKEGTPTCSEHFPQPTIGLHYSYLLSHFH